jgi:opacity protein-like surface antigen
MFIRSAITRAALLGALLVPATAGAQTTSPTWFAAPFFGATTGGDTTHTASTMGLSVGWKGQGHWGFEAEVADAPEFFEQDGFRIDRRVTTVMGNAIYALPMTGAKLTPYAAGGLGLVRPHLAEAGEFAVVEAKKLGFNVGGGLMGSLNDHVGLRGDVRYLRSVRSTDADTNPFGIDFSKFGFWRVTGGVVLKF